ncbi:MAG: GatB/YqeY domain-containing protein [Trebonia sp.]
MNELKERLRGDMTDAMRSRDQVRLRTLRMALAAITNEEVSGTSVHELSDEDILKVLTREAKKRREAAEAYESAGRADQAEAERAEGDVLAGYLPAQLADDELADLVRAAIAETGATGMPGMGKVMKAATPKVAGRADGGRVAAEVRRQLAAETGQ